MIRGDRLILLVLLGVALPASVAWLVVSATRLVTSATTYHQQVDDRPRGSPSPTTATADALAAAQVRAETWVMTAVAAVALSFILSLAVWLLSTRPCPVLPTEPDAP